MEINSITKRILSGLFVLTVIGALGVTIAGAVVDGNQLIVRFLTAVVIAALGLYVISDLRLQSRKTHLVREHDVTDSLIDQDILDDVAISETINNDSRFDPFVTSTYMPAISKNQHDINVYNDFFDVPSSEEAEIENQYEMVEVLDSESHEPVNNIYPQGSEQDNEFAWPEMKTWDVSTQSVDDGYINNGSEDYLVDNKIESNQISSSSDMSDLVQMVEDVEVDNQDELINKIPSEKVTDEFVKLDSHAKTVENISEANRIDNKSINPITDVNSDNGNFSKVNRMGIDLTDVVDLREVNTVEFKSSLDEAIKSGEEKVISTLIEQGMITTNGPITDRDVRTMVYVAFTSNELRKLVSAGGVPGQVNKNIDLGPVELFDETMYAPAPKTMYRRKNQLNNPDQMSEK